MSESGGAYPATVELNDHTILMVFYEEGEGSGIGALRFEKPEYASDEITFLPLGE